MKIKTITSINYVVLCSVALNEFLKEHRHVQQQNATIPCLQKQIEALTAGLQKVNCTARHSQAV